ncbi:hypothetical protein AtubIFM55763_001453 [Aspergillus tubingensis]|uniref:Uncharacterized protein n=1 Tax=Aspergillus tubingensis TaxID=5068 RepID=A0A9W6AYG2_ASPTU|nr:hypothetical protein AtubIFM55763_001453 [Aspergillus tubingensis]GLA89972.1 hypothetical protein AtubIFM56815_005517 [Aspergillus tubingensis]
MASAEQAIESLPEVSRTIGSLYSDILNQIRSENPRAYDVAFRVISWLLCMYEPLSPSAIMKAISTDFPGNFQIWLPNLLETCSNLVVHDKKIGTLRFAHITFKNTWKLYRNSIVLTHARAAHDCLSVCARKLPLNAGPVEVSWTSRSRPSSRCRKAPAKCRPVRAFSPGATHHDCDYGGSYRTARSREEEY